MALRPSPFKDYVFIDYATQVYSALVLLLVLLFHNLTVPHWGWIVLAHAVGIATVHWLVKRGTAENPPKSIDFFRHFYPVLFYIWFFAETGLMNRMFFKEYMDPVVIRWEQALFGCQPSILWMEKLPYLAVSELFYAAYFSYYLMIGGVGIALYLRNRQQFFHYVSVISFVFYVCYTVYIILPVIGPPVFFQQVFGFSLPADLKELAAHMGYPEAVQSGAFFKLMGWIYRVFDSPGAAIPSSHVAIAICTAFFSFLYLPRIRYVHLVAAILLCGSTVYCRYHYLTDVLAGIVTAGVLVPLGHWLYLRFEQSPGIGSPNAKQASSVSDPPPGVSPIL